MWKKILRAERRFLRGELGGGGGEFKSLEDYSKLGLNLCGPWALNFSSITTVKIAPSPQNMGKESQ